MKAITLWQPWATMIAVGLKQFETRHWATNYRGPLAIHAAKRWAKEQRAFTQELLDEPVIGLVLREHGYTTPNQLPLGGVVCTVNLNSIFTTEHVLVTKQVGIIERVLGDYSEGRYAWLLLDLKKFASPFPYPGAQGLWEWNKDDELSDEGVSPTRSISHCQVNETCIA